MNANSVPWKGSHWLEALLELESLCHEQMVEKVSSSSVLGATWALR